MIFDFGTSATPDLSGPLPPVVVVHGPLGSGKTHRLNQLVQSARRTDAVAVLTARCSPAESGRPYAAVGQLLAAAAQHAPSEELAEVSSMLPGVDGEREGAPGPPSVADALPALHRALAAVAGRAHPVLVLDDAEWADDATVELLDYALRRCGATPLTVVVAAVMGTPAPGSDRVAALAGTTGAVVESTAPMTPTEVALLLREAGGAVAALQPTVDAVMEQTEGNPMCVRTVLELLRGEPSSSSPESLALRVRTAWPAHLAGVVRSALHPFGEGVTELVSTLSVLRRPMPWDQAVRLLADGPRSATDLRTARSLGLVTDGDVVVRPPVLARALREHLPVPVRERAERAAADVLVQDGGADELVAEHLLHTAPPGQLADVDLLERAASAAATPEKAVAMLRRALRVRTGAERRARLLTLLGTLELHVNGSAALHHLMAARDLTTDPEGRARLTLRLSHAHAVLGSSRRAVGLLTHEIATTALDPDHPLVRTLRAETFFVSLGDSDEHRRLTAAPAGEAALRGPADAELPASPPRPRDRADDMLDAAQCLRDAWACRPAAQVLDRLSPSLVHGPRTTDELSVGLLVCGSVLVWADDLVGAEVFYDDALTDARFTGSRLGSSIALWMKGQIALRRGELAVAERLATEASEAVSGPRWGRWQHAPLVVLLPTLRELGETARALDAMRRAKGSGALPDLWLAQVVLSERARLRLEAGDHRGALSDAREAGAALTSVGCLNPAVSQWRITGAHAVQALGEHQEAGRLVQEHLDLARAWGAPSTVSTALTHVARLVPGRAAPAQLDEAVALADGTMPLVLARAHLARGRLLAQRDDVVGARGDLTVATELAAGAGAVVLAAAARAALVASGARPRVRASVLSEAERRVATLVRAGATNKGIAEELFLAQRTVESHLTAIYRKLGIAGRSQLAGALDSIGLGGMADTPGGASNGTSRDA